MSSRSIKSILIWYHSPRNQNDDQSIIILKYTHINLWYCYSGTVNKVILFILSGPDERTFSHGNCMPRDNDMLAAPIVSCRWTLENPRFRIVTSVWVIVCNFGDTPATQQTWFAFEVSSNTLKHPLALGIVDFCGRSESRDRGESLLRDFRAIGKFECAHQSLLKWNTEQCLKSRGRYVMMTSMIMSSTRFCNIFEIIRACFGKILKCRLLTKTKSFRHSKFVCHSLDDVLQAH
jgi:hypothetical protein